jgi:outer membrane receptor protein involved in Fe transport
MRSEREDYMNMISSNQTEAMDVCVKTARQARPNKALWSSSLLAMMALSPAISHAQAVDETPAAAQAKPNDDEIIVTARRTQERLIDVPVAASALSSEALQRYATSDLSSIANQVVGVQMNRTPSSSSGGSFSIRGVGNLANDLGNEQPVAMNFDGVQLTRGRVITMAQFDLQRIEVLKGPQALFFGRNSPAGVVSVLSQTPSLGGAIEGYVTAQYQFKTNTPAIEGAITLPLADNFAVRVAGRVSRMQDGYLRYVAEPRANPVPAEAGTILPGSGHKWGPGTKSSAVRATALWEPSDNFTVTLRSLYSVERNNGGSAIREVIHCGGSAPTSGGRPDPFGDCVANNVSSNGMPPLSITRNLYNAPEDGLPFSRTRVSLSSLTLDLAVGDIDLTSVTGYYDYKNSAFDNFDYTSFGQATNTQRDKGWQVSQEFRAVSNYDGPLNFSAGLFYQNERREYVAGSKIAALGPFTGPGPFNGLYDTLITTGQSRGTTYSAFGQLRWSILDNLELAGGARWTREEKSTDIGNIFNRLSLFSPAGFRYKPKFEGDNISPEATLTWKVTPDVTIYGAYKTGYLSGGASNPSTVANYSTQPDPTRPFLFDEETVEGGEIGIKTSQMGGRLTGDLTVYRYEYDGLQVQTFDSTTTSYFTQNAGGALNRGIEGQVRFRATPELTLRLAASYADLKFTEFDGAQCYAGQTVLPAPGAGTSKIPGACYSTGAGRARYMTGLRYGPAPFQAIAGISYDAPISADWGIGLTLDGYFYNRTPAWQIPTSPGGKPHQLVNASLRLNRLDESWQIALIATNLFDSRWYAPGTTDKPLGTPGDITGDSPVPRLVTLQATFRF